MKKLLNMLNADYIEVKVSYAKNKNNKFIYALYSI